MCLNASYDVSSFNTSPCDSYSREVECYIRTVYVTDKDKNTQWQAKWNLFSSDVVYIIKCLTVVNEILFWPSLKRWGNCQGEVTRYTLNSHWHVRNFIDVITLCLIINLNFRWYNHKKNEYDVFESVFKYFRPGS